MLRKTLYHCRILNEILSNKLSSNQESTMYTNNETNIENEVKKHLEKGDIDFELHFAERTFDKILLNELLGSFCGVSLPDNLNIKLNFSTTNLEDDLIKHLADKLSQINWPNKFKLNLLLRNNTMDDTAANHLLELFKKFDGYPQAEVVIDLDNNNSLSSSVIGNALEKIKNSTIDDNTVTSKDKSKTVKFCDYIVEEYLSTSNENGDDS